MQSSFSSDCEFPKKMALETNFAKEFENFQKICLELKEKSKKDEIRCSMLETEIENLKKRNQELEGKIVTIQKVLVDSTYVKNKVMNENKVLECEKRKAETELCFWKEKFKDLESNMKGIDEKFDEDVIVVSKGTKDAFHTRVRKGLPLEEEGCPSTPGAAQSPFHCIIDISDEDVNDNEIPKVKRVYGSRKCGNLAKSQCSQENNLQKTNLEHTDEEHMDEYRIHSSNTRSTKRKRTANIVTSDDEDSYNDNAPICTLKTQHSSWVSTDSEEEVNENVSRRHLRRLRKSESHTKQKESRFDLNKPIDLSEDEEDNDGVDEVESEDESLGGFIVDSPESVSNSDSESRDGTDESKDALNEYTEAMEKIGRKKIPNLEWELEADMLSDFGKDPELCMSAVCALYRRQTADEKESKKTRYQNERGFSQTDARWASELAEFLMGGDSDGDLNVTVEELKEYDSKGIGKCRALATKYSKQLFEIYQNKEDPYFPPQR